MATTESENGNGETKVGLKRKLTGPPRLLLGKGKSEQSDSCRLKLLSSTLKHSLQAHASQQTVPAEDDGSISEGRTVTFQMTMSLSENLTGTPSGEEQLVKPKDDHSMLDTKLEENVTKQRMKRRGRCFECFPLHRLKFLKRGKKTGQRRWTSEERKPVKISSDEKCVKRNERGVDIGMKRFWFPSSICRRQQGGQEVCVDESTSENTTAQPKRQLLNKKTDSDVKICDPETLTISVDVSVQPDVGSRPTQNLTLMRKRDIKDITVQQEPNMDVTKKSHSSRTDSDVFFSGFGEVFTDHKSPTKALSTGRCWGSCQVTPMGQGCPASSDLNVPDEDGNGMYDESLLVHSACSLVQAAVSRALDQLSKEDCPANIHEDVSICKEPA